MVDMVSLAELGDVVSGSTPKTHVKDYWNGDIPWITPADLTGHTGAFYRGKLKQITQAGFDSCSTTMLPAGSILFSSRAPIGHCAIAAYPLCTNQGFKSLVPNRQLDSLYGYYALRHLTPSIVAMGRGATFAEINKELFESIRIPLVPMHEQKRVAALLDKADRLRSTRCYARQLSDTFLQAVFLEMFGDPVRNLMGWDVETLQNVINPDRPITYGILKPGPHIPEGISYVRVVDMQDHGINLPEVRRTTRAIADEYKRSTLRDGDLLLSIRGHVGRLAVVPSILTGANITQDTARLASVEPFDTWYLLGCLSTLSMQEYMGNYVRGAAVQGINLGDVKELPIIFPPASKREKFAGIVRKLHRLRKQQAEAERQAEHLFQTLLHRAFRGELSGEKSVPEAEAPASVTPLQPRLDL